MSGPSSPSKATAAYPDASTIMTDLPSGRVGDSSITPPALSPSSTASNSESEQTDDIVAGPSSRRSRIERPRTADRTRSYSIIIPKDSEIEQRVKPEYPPDDARAMSPRRNSQDIEKLERGLRQSLQQQAKTLQSSLAALAEKIDEVKLDHDKLESENRFLQDYIGGLTRTMSKDNSLTRSASSSTKKKGKR